MSTDKELQKHVDGIADTLINGFDEDDLNEDGEQMSAYDYLFDVLDIEYIISSNREYLGARVLVAFGGPNIWINTRSGVVEGYWWQEQAFSSFTDNIGLDEALEEFWDMGA